MGLVLGALAAWAICVLPLAASLPAHEDGYRHQEWWPSLPRNVSDAPTISSPPQTPRHGLIPRGHFIIHCTVPGTVALTFDDGPHRYTNHLLDVFERHGARGTFFVNGDNMGRGLIDDPFTPWPETLRRMHRAGHQIGSHTWGHADLSTADPAIREQQVIRLEMAISNIFGWYPVYIRPPYGSCDAGCMGYLEARGYHVVHWDVDTRDYVNDTPELIRNSMDIFANTVSQDPSLHSYIALGHDVKQQTAEALVEFMLKTIQERGYKAVTVGECLGDPTENWYRK